MLFLVDLVINIHKNIRICQSAINSVVETIEYYCIWMGSFASKCSCVVILYLVIATNCNRIFLSLLHCHWSLSCFALCWTGYQRNEIGLFVSVSQHWLVTIISKPFMNFSRLYIFISVTCYMFFRRNFGFLSALIMALANFNAW